MCECSFPDSFERGKSRSHFFSYCLFLLLPPRANLQLSCIDEPNSVIHSWECGHMQIRRHCERFERSRGELPLWRTSRSGEIGSATLRSRIGADGTQGNPVLYSQGNCGSRRDSAMEVFTRARGCGRDVDPAFRRSTPKEADRGSYGEKSWRADLYPDPGGSRSFHTRPSLLGASANAPETNPGAPSKPTAFATLSAHG
jgi:hypothetical protein